MNASTRPERIALRVVAQNEHRATLSPYGFPMEGVFEFYPGEPAIFWPTDSAHPGTPDNCQLLKCFIGPTDIYAMLDNEQIDRIESAYLALRE